MRRHFLVIHNPKAGLKDGPLLLKTLTALEQAGCQLDFEVAYNVEDDIELASMAAKAGEVDAVVAAGGDSTIRGVALGLMGTDMPLGVLPVGTGNVLAQEIGLAKKPSVIADTLINGTVEPIKIGMTNDQPFLLMTGVGFDADVVGQLDHDLKQRIHKAAYVWPVIKALMRTLRQVSVCFDDEGNDCVTAQWVVVTRARHYGGQFILAPDASLRGDELQVVMFTDMSRLGLIRALIGFALGGNTKVMRNEGQGKGQKVRTRGVVIRSCWSVRITSDDAVPTQLDGELIDAVPPIIVTTSDQEVSLIVPTS